MNYYTFLDSPFGMIRLLSDGFSLIGLDLPDQKHMKPVQPDWIEDAELFIHENAKTQLSEYFDGQRKKFNLPVTLQGTKFQQQVWEVLSEIPYGETLSYKELAVMIKKPASVRAVGQANGRNPISIIIPCHRVIGADGSLTGYGGGIERKAMLLDFEKAVLANGHRKLEDMPACDLSLQRRS